MRRGAKKIDKQSFGTWGEQIAGEFLLKRGYIIIEKNFFCRMGEIDIIAYKQGEIAENILCFIEVKTRSRKIDGSAERSVGKQKIFHMQQAAIFYCRIKQINVEQQHISFEQVSVYTKKQHDTPQILWYQIPSF